MQRLARPVVPLKRPNMTQVYFRCSKSATTLVMSSSSSPSLLCSAKLNSPFYVP